jgi:hypothetical protein
MTGGRGVCSLPGNDEGVTIRWLEQDHLAAAAVVVVVVWGWAWCQVIMALRWC